MLSKQSTYPIQKVTIPEPLQRIASSPKQLYIKGAALDSLLDRPRVAIVGSRNPTPYGRQVTIQLAKELAEQGLLIISGLAIGVDGIAHRSALEAGGLTLAVLPGPLEQVAPRTHIGLAKQIIDGGGALISEYPAGSHPVRQNFIARNRLMAGLAEVIIITEAGEKSGSIHTANFAFEQNKRVLVVPGNITTSNAVGINNLLKASKAQVITSSQDVLNDLGLYGHKTPIRNIKGRNQHEQSILDQMLKGISDGADLLQASRLDISQFNQALTMLEIGGKIRPLGANHWAIC